MSAPRLSPAAALVRQLDPDLFHAALFAPEPERERLMVLYAFDIELSRAAAAATEPLIARMRLQWWRDLIGASAAGQAPPGHEVAAPLHRLLAAGTLSGDALEGLIDAREAELHGAMDEHRFGLWVDGRFGMLTRLAVHLLVGDNAAARRAAGAVGQALGVAFALRNAAAMAAESGCLLPDLGPEDRAALAGGLTTEHARATAHRLADQALAVLAAARAERRAVPRESAPALLPVWRAERLLRRARRPGFELAVHPAHAEDHPGRAVTLAWRALRGRW